MTWVTSTCIGGCGREGGGQLAGSCTMRTNNSPVHLALYAYQKVLTAHGVYVFAAMQVGLGRGTKRHTALVLTGG